MPKLTLGFTNRITWDNFEISAFIYAQTGNDVFNATRYYLEGMLETEIKQQPPSTVGYRKASLAMVKHPGLPET
jgi:hypothetical protein